MSQQICDLFITTAPPEMQKKDKGFVFSRQYSKAKSLIVPKKNQLFQLLDSLENVNRGIYKQAVFNLSLNELFFSIQKIRQHMTHQQDESKIKQFLYQLNCLKKQINNMNLTIKSKTRQKQTKRANLNKQIQISQCKKRSSKDPVLGQSNNPSNRTKIKVDNLSDSARELKNVLMAEIHYREKQLNFSNLQDRHIQKKNNFIKKKVQKAKQLNKQANEVHQKYIQKINGVYQNFKVVPIYQPNQKVQKSTITHSTKSGYQKLNKPKNNQDFFGDLKTINNRIDFSRPSTMKNILRSMKNIKSRVRFTATSVDQRKSWNRSQKNQNISHNNTYEDYLHRVTNKKAQIENQKENCSIYNAIKKQLRINQAKQRSKLFKQKRKKKNSQGQTQFFSKVNSPQKQIQKQQKQQKLIEENINNKMKNKQMYLQQKVLSIRQKLQKKQEKRRNFYQRQQKRFNKTCAESPLYVEQKSVQNSKYKLFNGKENSYQQEKIKNWHAKLLIKQKQQKTYQKLQILPLSVLKKKLAQIQLKQNQVPHFF